MRTVGHGNESSLHSALKEWLIFPEDQHEVEVDGYIIDIVRGDLLIEVQTGNFSSIKEKLRRLTRNHLVRLVLPIALCKWIVQISKDDGEFFRRRKSPKRGKLIDMFNELVRFPDLMIKQSFEMEVLMIYEEEVRCADGQGSWRRRGVSIRDHKLIKVVDSIRFSCPKDFLCFLPESLEVPFTSRQLANQLRISLRLAQRVTYSLRHMGILKVVGKKGRALLYMYPTLQLESYVTPVQILRE